MTGPVNRRSALSIGAGGLIAGPGLVQGAMKDQDYPSAPQEVMQGTKINGLEKDNLAYKAESQAKWFARRKEELNNIINGKFNDYQQQELEDERLKEDKVVLNIEALKSVSDPHKRQMKVDKYKETLKDRWIKNAKKELTSILKGGIG